MRKTIGILGVAALLLAGCYDDKGNYDYRDINDVLAIKFSPAPNSVTSDSVYTYTYPMSSEDTMYVTYTPTVTQSQAADDSQLEYQWIFTHNNSVSGVVSYDTLFSRELTLGFPYQELITFRPLFRLIDHSTGLEYYKEFNMSTREAYINSWYVLHGELGDRRIGVAEFTQNGEDMDVLVTQDAYETAFGERRFQNAVGMYYTSFDMLNALYGIWDNENLYVYEADSCTEMDAFSFEVRRTYQQMLYPNRDFLPIAEGVDDENGDSGSASASILRLVDGKCYWSRGSCGFYFSLKTTDATADYHADKVFIPEPLNQQEIALIWDNSRKKFYTYQLPRAPRLTEPLLAHPGDGVYDGNSVVRDVPEDAFEEGELADMEVVSMMLSSTAGKTGVIFRNTADNSYWYYDMGYAGVEGSELAFDVDRYPLVDMEIDENSVFASSIAYPNQFFFSVGGDIYQYNVVTDALNVIYSVTGTVVDMRFAIARTYYSPNHFPAGLNNRLGVAVNENGRGEVHDLRLATSGDVNDSYVATGFGPIVDMVFAANGPF